MIPWILQCRIQFLGLMREPAAVVFNMLVPLAIIFFQAAAFGDMEIGEELPDYRIVDFLPLSAAVMYAMTLGLFGLSVGLATMIESRTLAGYRLRKGGVSFVTSAYMVVLILVLGMGIVVSTVVSNIIWDVAWPGNVLLCVLAVVVGAGPFYACGFLIAVIVGATRSAQALSSVVFFPSLFLSGAVFPVELFPDRLQMVAKLLPGSHAYDLLVGAWFPDGSVSWKGMVYLMALTVVLTALATALFSRREDL